GWLAAVGLAYRVLPWSNGTWIARSCVGTLVPTFEKPETTSASKGKSPGSFTEFLERGRVFPPRFGAFLPPMGWGAGSAVWILLEADPPPRFPVSRCIP